MNKTAVSTGVVCLGVGLVSGAQMGAANAAPAPRVAAGARCPDGANNPYTLYGVTITFGAPKSDKASSSSFLKPGYVFQTVHVTMRDTGKYSYAYNPNDFIAVDAGARLYGQDTAFDDNLAQPLSTGKLKKGSVVNADLAFAMPRGKVPAAINWQPTGLGLYDPGTHNLDTSARLISLPK